MNEEGKEVLTSYCVFKAPINRGFGRNLVGRRELF